MTTDAQKVFLNDTEHPLVHRKSALVINDNPATESFTLAEEVALSINYNGINHAVMLVSPNDIEDFILGFSLSNDIIQHSRQLYGITLDYNEDYINADVEIANQAFWNFKKNKRTLAGTSGCGLCGAQALEQVLPKLEPLTAVSLPEPGWFEGLRDLISRTQVLAQRSGAVHGAVYVDLMRNILACREDIGRHNAFDKLIGAITTNKLFQPEGIVVLTSRCSLELVQKAIRAKFSILVTLSAPTALSVKWASRHGVTLVHVPKRDAPRAYTPNR